MDEHEPLLATSSKDSLDRTKLEISTHSQAPIFHTQSSTPHVSATSSTLNTPAPGHLPHMLSMNSDGFNENFANLSADYLKRRYRRRHENPEKINQLLTEYNRIVSNLVTAIEGKMDVAAIGVLHEILVSLDSGNNEGSTGKSNIDSGDRQRAYYKSNICTVITNVLKELGGQALVAEKALTAVAYLCRYSDENKASTCLENAKGFGLCGISDFVVGAIKLHKDNKSVFEAACDAVRSLCALESNRERLGASGACEAIGRGLIPFSSDPIILGWICRAIGHLANNNDANRELLASSGACENIVNILQKYPANLNVCTEACWAIRQLAVNEDNRTRFANDFAPESIMAVFKNHFASDAFAIEATHALVVLVGSDEDDTVVRIENSGFVPMSLKTLKKNMDSEILARWVYNMLYHIACDDRFIARILKTEVLDILALSFENHASFEAMAEWGCRFVHILATDENAISRMRSAGMCEMVTSAVQRQSISKTVSSVGCLAIGDLAKDNSNQARLSSAGAVDAVVQALKRHNSQVDVCYNSCYAIHYLCNTQNNISWMGANGACEAVTSALLKHHETSEDVAVFASNAMASLAYKDEGNQQRFNHAGACKAITDTLRTHAKNPLVAENACRAIYNLCAENVNVKDLGANDACGLVVMILQEHANKSNVIAQALLATAGLAVKAKSDKVHKGNTRKLVDKGAIEIIVAVMQKFADKEDVQRAAGSAISSLARLEVNRNKFGIAGACELVSNSIQLHLSSAPVVAKLAGAVDVLCTNSVQNRGKFSALKTVENLIAALHKHEKNASLVIECLKALVNLAYVEGNKPKIFNEQTFRLYVKVMKLHEKNDKAAWWTCTIISSAAYNKENLLGLGQAKACENVINVLARHGEANPNVAQWGCNCVVALSLLDENKGKFHNSDACQAIVKALASHYQNTLVAQFGSASIASLAVFPQNRSRLAQAKASQALCNTLSYQNANENIIRFTCEAISEISDDKTNQQMLKSDGVCDILVNLYIQHAANANVTSDLLHAMSAVAFGQPEIGTKFVDLGVGQYIMNGIATHAATSRPFAEFAASAIASIVGKNPKHQVVLTDLDAVETLAEVLIAHKDIRAVVTQILRALRILTTNSKESQARVTKHETLLPTIMDLLNVHILVPVIVEHACWILGTMDFKPITDRSKSNSVADATPYTESTVDSTVQQPSNSAPPSLRSPSLVGVFNSSVPVVTPSTTKQFYGNSAHWDLLLSALKTHESKPNPFRCVCMAITMFSNKGKLPHMSICTVLVQVLEKHVDDEYELHRILEAIGALARNHPMNNQKLSDDNICEIIDSIISGHQDGSVVIHGVFQAIAGLSENSSENKDAFNLLPNTCMSIANILYNELETDAISQYGCLVVSALVKNHPKNQIKLTSVCSYIADVLSYHRNNIPICIEACRAISCLAHKNFTNRNRLGSSDVSSSIMKMITPVFDDQLQSSWKKYDTTLIYWVIKAIGDLSANNPNNQTKLGNHGACELLVKVLDRKHIEGQIVQEAKVISNVLWAIGNLVQLGKGSSMIIQDLSEATTDPIPSGDVQPESSFLVSTRSASSGAPGAATSNRMNLTLLSQTKVVKNTTRFYKANVSEKLKKVIYDFIEYPDVILWSARAVNNLAKSQKLKQNLLDNGLLDALHGILQKYNNVTKNNEIVEWANLAKESLTAANT